MSTHPHFPRCLTIAGSDSGGGAGIQADIKTISALGVFATSAVTAVTAQNTLGVTSIAPLEPSIISAQIDAVLSDIGADALKIGMLHNSATVNVVVRMINEYCPEHVVLDPVMISTSGHHLIEPQTISYIKHKLLPLASLVTPNIDEAELLTDISISTREDIFLAASRLMGMGCKAVLMKGGHLKGEEALDILFEEGQPPLELSVPFIESKNTHGTGCTLSSAIAAFLAKGYSLREAVSESKVFITKAIAASSEVKIGAGNGPLNHFFDPMPLKPLE